MEAVVGSEAHIVVRAELALCAIRKMYQSKWSAIIGSENDFKHSNTWIKNPKLIVLRSGFYGAQSEMLRVNAELEISIAKALKTDSQRYP
jgi:hypothetical protein